MNRIFIFGTILFFISFQPFQSKGQNDSSTAISKKVESSKEEKGTLKIPPVRDKKESARVSFMSDREFHLGIVLLVFGIIVIIIEYLIIKNIPNIKTENAIKFIGVTLIIIGGLFLITSGFSGEEIAPIVGLLGTVAGYLLGKSE